MTPLPPSARHRLALSAASASALLALVACGAEESTSASDQTTTATTSTDTAASAAYTPGDYTATGSYTTPGGRQSVEVEVTLEADGTITDVTVIPLADGGNSEQFQTKFAGGIAAEVVGTKIDDLSVSKVSGSSLTSGGFNAAIEEIKDEAAA
ncbi:MAG: FMN-binding protein [Aeromicrobium sp.]|uniref:FMN-binding protein n=1 Tax=Aeromicrobium sp. TaxID=1871063 RepID=UPI0039E39936